MGYTANRFVSEYKELNRSRANEIIMIVLLSPTILSVFISICLCFFSSNVSYFLFKNSSFSIVIKLYSGILLFHSLGLSFIGIFSGLKRYSELAIYGSIAGLLYFILGVLGGIYLGISGALFGIYVSFIIFDLLMLFRLKTISSYEGFHLSCFNLKKEKELFFLWVFPGVLGGLLSNGAIWILQKSIINPINGSSELANYSVAFSLLSIVLFLPNIINSVGASFINATLKTNSDKDYREVFFINLKLSVLMTFLIVIIMIMFGKILIGIFGEKYTNAMPVFYILTFAAIPESLTIAFSQVIQTKKKVWGTIWFVNLPRDLFIILGAILLINSNSANGAATIYFFGRIIGLAGTSFFVNRLYPGLLKKSFERIINKK